VLFPVELHAIDRGSQVIEYYPYVYMKTRKITSYRVIIVGNVQSQNHRTELFSEL